MQELNPAFFVKTCFKNFFWLIFCDTDTDSSDLKFSTALLMSNL